MAPLQIDEVRSTFFDRLPAGAAVPDSAFLMADLATTWRPQPVMATPVEAATRQ